jgi:hypothetical protein
MECSRNVVKLTRKFFHFGVVVKDIPKTIEALTILLGGKASPVRKVNHEYIGELVGVDKVEVEIVMFETQSGEFIEILKWSKTSDFGLKEITDLSVAHLCLYVEDIESIWKKASSSDLIEIISKKLMRVPIGPNEGSLVFFVKVNKEFYLELFQKTTLKNSL